MAKKTFNAYNHIIDFNKVKTNLNSCFTQEEFRSELKKAGIPSNRNFFFMFLKNKVIERKSNGIYTFKSKEPLHYSGLQRIYDAYYAQTKSWNSKKKPQKEESKHESITEEQAINLLKGLGYKILKPIYTEI